MAKVSALVLLLALLAFAQCQIISFDQHDETLVINDSIDLGVSLSNNAGASPVTVTFKAEHDGIVTIKPLSVTLVGTTARATITLTGVAPGHVLVNGVVTSTAVANVDGAYVRVTVANSLALDTVSVVVGWLYFVAWSVSFYPQIYINWKRKSVIGLNFDFLALNLLGFFLYSAFNLGLSYIPSVEQEYFQRHPKGLNPVQINDVVFAIHAFFAVVLTIVQCFIYERGDQKVSKISKGLVFVFFLFLLISAVLAGCGVIMWLDFLYYCSYVKLAITLIKYNPQAYMNYKRKSTSGWSIGNILLDFTGGILSMLQMIIISYNFNDWDSIFGDPTKFGLGLFSVLYDILFMVQHYCLYRNTTYDEVEGSTISNHGNSRTELPT